MAIWKTVDGQRFQNYQAVFTILKLNIVPRAWLTELRQGERLGPSCPTVWRQWVASGKAAALRAERVTRVRSKAQQLGDQRQRDMAETVHEHFRARPHAFEQFAADIVRLMDQNVVGIDVTRASRDGGRDAVGKYRIGQPQNCVTVDFAMEASATSRRRGSEWR